MALGSQLNQQVDNPFFGIVNNGVLAAQRVSRAQLLRPFPQFTDVIPLLPSGSTTSYQALQISWNKRMSGGLLVAGSYAYSKAMETGENHQDSFDIAASNSIASYDIPHRFVTNVLYELPFGPGRRVWQPLAQRRRRRPGRLGNQRHHHGAERITALDQRQQHGGHFRRAH